MKRLEVRSIWLAACLLGSAAQSARAGIAEEQAALAVESCVGDQIERYDDGAILPEDMAQIVLRTCDAEIENLSYLQLKAGGRGGASLRADVRSRVINMVGGFRGERQQ